MHSCVILRNNVLLNLVGKGIPNDLSLNSGTSVIPSHIIPAVDIATTDYEREQGSLTHSSNFGVDPLEDRQDLIKRRDDLFHAKGFVYEDIFTNTVSGDGHYLINAILTYIDLSNRLSKLL